MAIRLFLSMLNVVSMLKCRTECSRHTLVVDRTTFCLVSLALFSRICAVVSFSVVQSFLVVRDLEALHTSSDSAHDHCICEVSISGTWCCMHDVSYEMSHDVAVVISSCCAVGNSANGGGT